MLSNVDAMDTTELVSKQEAIRSLGVTINQYVKTLQGRQMVETQRHFVLNGKLYQGFNQRAVECDEKLCTVEELEGASDVDGTKSALMASRSRRLEGAKLSKDRELSGRKRAEIANERDALELMLLKKKVAAMDEDEQDEAEPTKATETDKPVERFGCETCGKSYDNFRALNAHKMGSKH